MTGVTALTRKTKEVYRIAFSYRGVQCRETLAMPHSKANEAYCDRLRGEILRKIELGTFVYTEFFPDSGRAAVFGHRPAKTQTLKVALEAYRDRTARTLEASTAAGYRRAIDNVLVPHFGDVQIAALKPSDIRDWVSLQSVTLKRIRNVLLPLRAVLNEAVADELIAFNPLDRIDLAKLVPVAKRTSDYVPQPYTSDELRTLLANLPVPERWAFQLWAFTGLRTGELIGLRWPRVDLEANTLSVTETTTERQDKPRPKTKAGVRTIPLLPAAREAIDALRPLTQLGGDRVVANPRSTRDDKAWDDKRLAEAWRKAHKGTRIAYRQPYELRHTFASQLLSQGENVAHIAHLLGHANIHMVVQTYGKWVQEGEALGFDRPPRRYGMERLWDQPAQAQNE